MGSKAFLDILEEDKHFPVTLLLQDCPSGGLVNILIVDREKNKGGCVYKKKARLNEGVEK